MKKILYLAAVAMLIGMVSCSTDEGVVAEPSKKAVSFTASVDAESRVVIDGAKINWVKGDSIGIVHLGSFQRSDYDPTDVYIMSSLYTTDDEGATASFVKDEWATTPEGTAFYGVYPNWGLDWCSGNFEEGRFEMELRAEQKVNPDGGFCYPHPFMLAYTENNELNFKNICTIFKIEIGSSGVTDILLEGENLVGPCTVSGVRTGAFTYQPNEESDSRNEIRIAGHFMEGTTIYAFGWPTTTKLRMSVNGEVVKELTVAKEFKRNTVYNLGVVKVPNHIYVYNFIEESGSTDWASRMNLWSWNSFTPSTNYTGGTWPGVMMTPPDRDNYEDLYSYEMPEEARNEVVQLLFSGGTGSPQTGDSMPFILNRDFYFRVFYDTETQSHGVSFAHDWDYYYATDYRTIYVPVESLPTNWANLYIYAWDESGILTAPWPGSCMSEEDWQIYHFSDGKDYYIYSFDNDFAMSDRVNVVFNDGQSGGGNHQTGDIRIRMDQNRCVVLSNEVDSNGNRAWTEALSPCYQWEQIWW